MDINKFVKNEARPLPVILMLDTSGSMSGEKIEVLNSAVKDMIADFKNERLTEISLHLAIITFGGNAEVHNELMPVNQIEFSNLSANGMTPMGGALQLAINLINDKEKVSSKGYKPIVVLVSDGMPNDNWKEPLDEFINGKRTSKCERWALGIGQDADYAMLEMFLNDKEKKVFDASAAKEITKFFRFVTMSTIARTRSANPNESINFEELTEKFKEDKPKFDFGL